LDIAPSASAAGLSAPVAVKTQFVGFIRTGRRDGIVGADHVAHGTPHTLISRVGSLADSVVRFIDTGGRLAKSDRRLKLALAKYPELNGIDGAHGRAFAAKRAFIFMPYNLPRKVFDT
jgi:hypothetical protein